MMKASRISKALTLLAVAAISLGGQTPITLRRALKANTKLSYNLVTETHINADTPMGAQEGSFKSIGTVVTSTGSVKGDSADYTMITTVDHLDTEGVMAAAGMPDKVPPVTVKGTLDALNRVKNEKIIGTTEAAGPMSMLGGSGSSMLGVSVSFPDHPVSAGDTWKVDVPGNVMNKQAQTLNAKLVGIRELDGRNLLVVSLSGQLIIDPDPAAMKQAGQTGGAAGMDLDMKIKGTSDIDSEILIDPATGETVAATSKIKGKVDVDITAIQATFHAASDTSVKMTRIK